MKTRVFTFFLGLSTAALAADDYCVGRVKAGVYSVNWWFEYSCGGTRSVEDCSRNECANDLYKALAAKGYQYVKLIKAPDSPVKIYVYRRANLTTALAKNFCFVFSEVSNTITCDDGSTTTFGINGLRERMPMESFIPIMKERSYSLLQGFSIGSEGERKIQLYGK